MKRGEIYLIRVPDGIGHEMRKDRPGIIVSKITAGMQTTVNVVLCSSSTRRELPTHVTIRSTQRVSQAMCEHILTVDISRVGPYLCEASPQEMQALDIALATALELNFGGNRELAAPATPPAPEPVTVPAEPDAGLRAELAVYKMLYNDLLSRMLGGAR